MIFEFLDAGRTVLSDHEKEAYNFDTKSMIVSPRIVFVESDASTNLLALRFKSPKLIKNRGCNVLKHTTFA